MNGTKYLLDTNAIIALLNGDDTIEEKLQTAEWIGTSVLCIIEFLSFYALTANDKNLLQKLMQRIEIIPIENSLPELMQVALLRRQTRLKLPDAVIAATAIKHNARLITNDKHFIAISNLSVTTF
jgi:predicted nucleic acid-binding protein